jgi:hypothetical protein
MRYRGDVPGRPDDLTAPGDVEELAEMIGNEGSELVDCCTVAPMWPAEGPAEVRPKSRNGDIKGGMQKGDVGCRGRRSPFLPPCYFTFSGIELASWASTHWTNCSGDPPKSSGRGPAWRGRLGKGPRVDRPETPRPGRRGLVDLADHHRLRPAPPRPLVAHLTTS